MMLRLMMQHLPCSYFFWQRLLILPGANNGLETLVVGINLLPLDCLAAIPQLFCIASFFVIKGLAAHEEGLIEFVLILLLQALLLLSSGLQGFLFFCFCTAFIFLAFFSFWPSIAAICFFCAAVILS